MRNGHQTCNEMFISQLHPPDSTIAEYSKKEMADAKTYARKLMVVNLSDKANEEKKKEEETVTIDPVKSHK